VAASLGGRKTAKPDPRGNQNARDRNSRMIAVVQKRALIDRFSYWTVSVIGPNQARFREIGKPAPKLN
jgi:hypothetical protein